MRILKRKKGQREYYYLQHSLRQNNKVITKEKYLGKDIAQNIEKIKKEFLKQFENILNKKLLAIKINFQEEWKRIPESMKQKQLNEVAISFTFNTNAIEGSKITLEETREIIQDKISPNKPIRDVRETEAHAKVFLKMLEEKEKISKELLFRWHKEIFLESKPDLAGRYRDFLARVGDYLTPDWQDIENLMENFFKFLNSKESHKLNPIEFSARAHYKFEKIHPFGDGNGRIGRLLMNYILWTASYPLLIIPYKRRNSYYKALKNTEDLFVKYFTRYYISVHKKRAIIA